MKAFPVEFHILDDENENRLVILLILTRLIFLLSFNRLRILYAIYLFYLREALFLFAKFIISF